MGRPDVISTPCDVHPQVEQLQAVIAKKESLLAEALAEVCSMLCSHGMCAPVSVCVCDNGLVGPCHGHDEMGAKNMLLPVMMALQVKDLKAGGAKGSGARSAEASAAVAEVTQQRDEARRRVSVLEAQVSALEADLTRKVFTAAGMENLCWHIWNKQSSAGVQCGLDRCQ